ncbi:MAG: ATP-binding cassette domain-containing protein [Gemmataceae bacterium]
MPDAPSSSLPPPGEPVMRLRHVNHYFVKGETRTQVLIDVNLEVMPGELVILSGPSGCGKTTLLTLLGGLRTLEEGEIDIWDPHRREYRSLRGMAEPELVEVRRSIGFIFQRHNLLEALTAMQNVRMAQRLGPGDADPDDDARRMLTYLGLERAIHEKPRKLSGGMCQRVAVARALINRPRLVLADEPTAALDKTSSSLVVTLLRQLSREAPVSGDIPAAQAALLPRLATRRGCTSLIVTHQLEISREADRIVEMEYGRIINNVIVAERMFLYNGLRGSPAFAVFLPEELYKLADSMSVGVHLDQPVLTPPPDAKGEVETFPAGAVILRQGEHLNEQSKYYLIRSGRVEVRKADDAGHERTVNRLGRGDSFGDVAMVKALIDTDVPRNASIVAAEPTTLYTLTLAKLRGLVREWGHSVVRGGTPLLESVKQFIYRVEVFTGREQAAPGAGEPRPG